MPKSLFTSAALGAFIATGAFAQTEPAADPALETTSPPAADTGMIAPAPAPLELTGDWVIDESFLPVDVATVTAEEIIGASVRTVDGEVIASVSDLVLGADGNAESVATTFGGFLGFGSDTVLLQLDEVEIVRSDSGTVALRTALTPETLEGRPTYEG